MLGRGEWKKQRVNSSLDKQVGKIRQKQNYSTWIGTSVQAKWEWKCGWLADERQMSHFMCQMSLLGFFSFFFFLGSSLSPNLPTLQQMYPIFSLPSSLWLLSMFSSARGIVFSLIDQLWRWQRYQSKVILIFPFETCLLFHFVSSSSFSNHPVKIFM